MNQEVVVAESPPSAAQVALPSRSLWANASWTLIGNVAYAACQGVWLILLAKFVTDDSVGDFILGLSIATPVFVFSGLSLRYVLATDVGGEFSFFEYVAVRLITTLAALGVILLVSTGAVVMGLSSISTVFVIGAISAAKGLENISDIIFGKFQNEERLDLIGLSMTLKGVLSLVGMSIGLFVAHNAFGAAIGLSCAWLGVLFLYDLPQVFMLSGEDARPGLGKYVSTLHAKTSGHGRLPSRMVQLGVRAAPLAFANGIYTLNPNIVQYFTRACVGKELYGIFGTLQYGATAGTMIMTAVGAATISRFARFYTVGKYSQFRSLLARMIVIAMALGISSVFFALFAGRPILTVLFTPNYAAHNHILAWLLGAATLSYVAGLLGFAATATRTFQRFTIPYLGISLVAIVASARLVPRWEMLGAALAFGAIHLASVTAFSWILQRAGVTRVDVDAENSAVHEPLPK